MMPSEYLNKRKLCVLWFKDYKTIEKFLKLCDNDYKIHWFGGQSPSYELPRIKDALKDSEINDYHTRGRMSVVQLGIYYRSDNIRFSWDIIIPRIEYYYNNRDNDIETGENLLRDIITDIIILNKGD